MQCSWIRNALLNLSDEQQGQIRPIRMLRRVVGIYDIAGSLRSVTRGVARKIEHHMFV